MTNSRTRFMKITHCVAMAGAGALFALTAFNQTADTTVHFEHRHEPDKWVNLVCNAKDQGSTPAQTANWLVTQYGLGPAAASQHTMNHWAACK